MRENVFQTNLRGFIGSAWNRQTERNILEVVIQKALDQKISCGQLADIYD